MPPNIYPSTNHAGAYSAVLHYLKAAAAMGPAQAKASGRAAIERMKAMPTEDDCFGPGRVREDGRGDRRHGGRSVDQGQRHRPGGKRPGRRGDHRAGRPARGRQDLAR